MPKIAFLDVDMTLVDNHTSEYNENLIKFLQDAQFDQVYLVTGRNVNDFWQHVLQLGKKPQNWRQQLLFNVVDYLKSKNIRVAGVSTPYDHYLSRTQSALEQHAVEQAGDAAEKLYMPFEREIAALKDEEITKDVLCARFSSLTGGVRYPNGLGENEELTSALPTYLAMTGDTEKKGQFEFLLEHVKHKSDGPMEFFFFDDKPENLCQAQAVFDAHQIAFRRIHVTKVAGYQIPVELTEQARVKSSEGSGPSQRSEEQPTDSRGESEELDLCTIEPYRIDVNGLLSLLNPILERQRTRLYAFPKAHAAITFLQSQFNLAVECYLLDPSPNAKALLKERCIIVIKHAEQELGKHRNLFGKFFATIKHFFNALFQGKNKPTHRMKFFDTRTESSRMLEEIKVDIGKF
jgi:hypothetical protein